MSPFNLHRSDTQPEWSSVAPADYSRWQRWAAVSNGVITPANLITTVGGILTLAGLTIMAFGHLSWFALLLVTVGRAADVADGYVAERTRTKSPLGEMLDVTVDKIVIFYGLICLLIGGLVPAIVVAIICLLSALNTGLGIAAKKKHFVLHPTVAGKLAAGLCWGAIVCFLLAELIHTQLLNICAVFLVVLFSFTGLYAAAMYSRDYRQGIRNAHDN